MDGLEFLDTGRNDHATVRPAIPYDGGPAFPRPASEYTASGTLPDGNDAIQAQAGMSLRDWFAGMALQGLIGAQEYEKIAKHCYYIADAMLSARHK
jgi:hypothetical protein